MEDRMLLSGTGMDDLSALSDEFNDAAATADWQRVNEVEGWNADQLHTYDINQTQPGQLVMAPETVVWFDNWRGPMAFKNVTGDFVFTTQVHISDRDDVGIPDADDVPNEALFSLGGAMIRTPRDISNPATDWQPGTMLNDGTNNGENYVFLSMGHGTNGNFTFEVKTTRNSNSQLQLTPTDSNTATVQLARIGNSIIALLQVPGEDWIVHRRYSRPDMPETLQVGIVSYTDWNKASDFDPFYHNGHVLTEGGFDPTPNEAFNPDLVAGYEYARYVRPQVPTELDGVNLLTVATDEQLLSFLGENANTPAPTNDLPTISDITNLSIPEDTATSAIAFAVGDAETPAGSLTVAGTSSNTALVPNGNIVFAGSGANRTVTVTPAANQTGTAIITVTVTDADSGTANDTFVLTVTAANDLPSITGVADLSTDEDTATSAIAFSISDVETPAGSLTVAGTSSNTALVPNGNIVFAGSGANRTVTVTPAANQTGTAIITVTVTDADSGTANDTFVLTVTDTNDLPSITGIADLSTDEDTATSAIAFSISDVETPAGSLTVAGTSSNTALVPNVNIVFGGSGANRTVTVTPAANQSGTATITVTVTDADSGTASDTFVLTVTAANDLPTISVGDQNYTEDQDGGNAVQLDSAATVNDSEGDAEWDGGTLTIQVTANAEPGDEISIRNNVVGNINTAGTNLLNGGTVIGTLSSAEGTVTGGTALTITFNSNATNALVQQVLRAVSYRTISDTPTAGSRTMTFTATDRHGDSSNDTSVVSVTPNNDPATVSFANVVSLPEDMNTSSNIKVADIVITDPDGGTNTLTVGGADDAFFSLTGTELFLLAGTSLDFDTKPSYSIEVSVDDTSIPGAPDDTTPLVVDVTELLQPLVLDDGDAEFSTVGSWPRISNKPGVQNRDFLYNIAGTGQDQATWLFNSVPMGQYRISVSYRAFGNRASNAPFTILDGAAQLTTVLVNQQQAANSLTEGGIGFHDLGTFNLVSGTLSILLTDQADGLVIADAIRIERLGDVVPGAEVQVTVDGGVLDDDSGLVDFGDVEADRPPTKSFTVTNLGTTNLILTSPVTVPAGFVLVSGFTSTVLAPFASTTFEITVDTSSLGFQNGQASFGNNDAGGEENPFNFTLQANVVSPTGIQLIDNGDLGFSTAGSWVTISGNGKGHGNDFQYANSGTGANSATWTFDVVPGQYQIAAAWREHTNRSVSAPFTVSNGTAEILTATVNQSVPAVGISDEGSSFTSLGVFNISSTTLVVTLRDNTTGLVIADAVRIERVGNIPSGPEIGVIDDGVEVVDETGVVDFGDVELGDVVARTLTVFNFGTTPLILAPPITTPTGFTATNFGTTTIAPNSSTTFGLQIDTSVLGSLNGSVSFGSNDSDESTFNFTVQGNVIPASTIQVIDNGGAGFSQTGSWVGVGRNGHDNNFDYAVGSAVAQSTSTWTFVLADPGQYRVSATWRQHSNRASNARFALNDEFLSTVLVDQRVKPNISNGIEEEGSVFEDLGVFRILGNTLTVTLDNLADALVIADAIRIERVGDL